MTNLMFNRPPNTHQNQYSIHESQNNKHIARAWAHDESPAIRESKEVWMLKWNAANLQTKNFEMRTTTRSRFLSTTEQYVPVYLSDERYKEARLRNFGIRTLSKNFGVDVCAARPARIWHDVFRRPTVRPRVDPTRPVSLNYRSCSLVFPIGIDGTFHDEVCSSYFAQTLVPSMRPYSLYTLCQINNHAHMARVLGEVYAHSPAHFEVL